MGNEGSLQPLPVAAGVGTPTHNTVQCVGIVLYPLQCAFFLVNRKRTVFRGLPQKGDHYWPPDVTTNGVRR
jgi:hypothetical protein